MKNITVKEDTNLQDAIKIMNDGGQQILLVIDDKGLLKGILTDGDLRRHILKNGSFEIPISDVMNREYVALNEKEKYKAEKLLQTTAYNHIPIIDDDGKLIDVVGIAMYVKHKEKEKDNYVVIMAGGKGTRLEPVTKIIPKPLLPIGDKTMLEIVIDKFYGEGFRKYVAVLNYKKGMIKAYFTENSKHAISFLEEPFYMGTVGALTLLKKELDKTFILSNCDIFADLDYDGMLQWHKEHNADMTLLGVREKVDIPYGVIKTNQNNYVTGVQEKPNYTFLINTGIYILEPSIVNLIPQNEGFQMNQLIDKALNLKKKIACYPIHGNWYDTGQFLEYKKTISKLKNLNI